MSQFYRNLLAGPIRPRRCTPGCPTRHDSSDPPARGPGPGAQARPGGRESAPGLALLLGRLRPQHGRTLIGWHGPDAVPSSRARRAAPPALSPHRPWSMDRHPAGERTVPSGGPGTAVRPFRETVTAARGAAGVGEDAGAAPRCSRGSIPAMESPERAPPHRPRAGRPGGIRHVRPARRRRDRGRKDVVRVEAVRLDDLLRDRILARAQDHPGRSYRTPAGKSRPPSSRCPTSRPSPGSSARRACDPRNRADPDRSDRCRLMAIRTTCHFSPQAARAIRA